MTTWVYGFDDLDAARAVCDGDWDAVRGLLGGKGANLADMVDFGVPVPPGFTITTGVDVGDSETEMFWTEFLRDLKDRGLAGVQLVISDAHAGLKAAIRRVLQGSAWQRCRVHYAEDQVMPTWLREPLPDQHAAYRHGDVV